MLLFCALPWGEVLHIEGRSEDDARLLLKTAIRTGFKECAAEAIPAINGKFRSAITCVPALNNALVFLIECGFW